MRLKIIVICSILLLCGSIVLADFGTKKRMPRPQEFGNVVINNYSEKNNIAPVVFKHWLHRSKYTCRVCHVDIGFAMTAGGTDIRESDIQGGLYCGACHNGRESFSPKIDKLVTETKNCDRCHSYGKTIQGEKDFKEFFRNYPNERFGNGVDWLKAEEKALIKPKDFVEGVSIKREAIKAQKDFDIKSTILGMPDIIFSHKIHAEISGCELCHPEIFSSKKGATKYSMQEIFAGRYCGACHAKVAFPFYDCQRCHMKPVY